MDELPNTKKGSLHFAQRFQSGNVDAVNAVFSYGIRLACIRGIADRTEQEEVASLSVVRVWRGLPGFSARRGSFRSWVSGVIRNTIIDVYRSRSKNRKTSLLLESDMRARCSCEEDSPLSRIPDPRQALYEDPDTVLRVLRRVDQDETISLIVRMWVNGCGYQHIANACNIPVGTVKSKLHNLKEHLPEYERYSRA